MKRISRSDLNNRGTRFTLKRHFAFERLENRSLLAGFPIAFGDGGGTSCIRRTA